VPRLYKKKKDRKDKDKYRKKTLTAETTTNEGYSVVVIHYIDGTCLVIQGKERARLYMGFKLSGSVIIFQREYFFPNAI